MGELDAWSDRILSEFTVRFTRHVERQKTWDMDVDPVVLVWSRVDGPDAVEIAFDAPWRSSIFGVRLEGSMWLSDDYGSTGSALKDVDISDVVDDMIHLLADEPFDDDEVGVVEPDGFEWRRVHLDS